MEGFGENRAFSSSIVLCSWRRLMSVQLLIIISKPCCSVCVFCWPYELLFLLLCCFALATRGSPYYLKLVPCRFNRFHPLMLSLVCMFGGRAPVAEARHIGFDSRPPTPTLGGACVCQRPADVACWFSWHAECVSLDV